MNKCSKKPKNTFFSKKINKSQLLKPMPKWYFRFGFADKTAILTPFRDSNTLIGTYCVRLF